MSAKSEHRKAVRALAACKLSEAQLNAAAAKLAQAVAAPEDQEFFRGVLHCKLMTENETAGGSSAVAAFVARFLREAGG